MPEDVRGIIVGRAFGNDLNIRRQIRNYIADIAANETDNTAIREGLRESRAEYDGLSDEDKKLRAASLKEESDAAYDAIRKNKIDRVTAYRELRAALAEAISSGADRETTR